MSTTDPVGQASISWQKNENTYGLQTPNKDA